MTNKELGEYLRTVRESLGYSTYDVNKLCDISPSYLSLMETGKRKPSAVILKKIAPIYCLDYLDLYKKAGYIDLLEYESLKSQNSLYTNELSDQLKNIGAMYVSTTDMVSIPILGTVKAGYDYMAQENWEGTVQIKETLAKTGDFFALRIVGDSMLDVLWENDIIAVKKQSFANSGDIAVVLINGNEATVKKINILDNGIMLIPFNSNYNPVFFSQKDIEIKPVNIIGIVKQIIERNF